MVSFLWVHTWLLVRTSLVLGVPAFLLVKRFNAIRWWTCIIVSFLIGGLGSLSILDTWMHFVPFGLFGASGGLAFWLLWRFSIPSDQQAKT